MLSRYGYRFEEKSDEDAGYYAINTSAEGFSEILQTPYFFLFGGFMDTGSNTIWVTGAEGKIWGASAESEYHTKYMGYSKRMLTPTVIWWQGQGLSLVA